MLSPLADPLVNALFLEFPDSEAAHEIRKRLLPIAVGVVVTIEAPTRPLRKTELEKAIVRPVSSDDVEPTLASILQEVALKHGTTVGHLKGHRKHKALVAARFEFYYRAVTETTKSMPVIGKAVNKDHSSVISGLKRTCKRLGLEYPNAYQAPIIGKERDTNGRFTRNQIIGFTEPSMPLGNG